MSYDLTKKTTLKHLQSTTTQLRSYVDTKIANLPVEKFLDQAKTTFVYSFTFNAETYPGATNPNLDGKAVLVMAVKGVDNSVAYSFLDLSELIDVNKIDKVAAAVAGNLPSFVSGGNVQDSGIAVANVITTADIATDAEVTEMLTEALSD